MFNFRLTDLQLADSQLNSQTRNSQIRNSQTRNSQTRNSQTRNSQTRNSQTRNSQTRNSQLADSQLAYYTNSCTEYRLLSEPMSTRLLNSISSRICGQNTQFNMYTTTSKQEEGWAFKDSHPKCFITTNFDKFHREAFARGGESR